MGGATAKCNEAKSKMKHPSDMPTQRFKLGGSDLWSNTLPSRPWRRPRIKHEYMHALKCETIHPQSLTQNVQCVLKVN